MSKIIRKIHEAQNARTTKKMLDYLLKHPDVTYYDVVYNSTHRTTVLSDYKLFVFARTDI